MRASDFSWTPTSERALGVDSFQPFDSLNQGSFVLWLVLFIVLGVDSFSILFSHRSFQTPIAFSPGFLESRIPGKNGEVTSSRAPHPRPNGVVQVPNSLLQSKSKSG